MSDGTHEELLNPAKRLALILQAGKVLNPSMNTGLAFSQLFGIKDSKEPLFYSQAGRLISLVDEIFNDLNKTPIDSKRLKEPLANIKNHIVANLMQLNGSWAQFINAITPDSIILLEFTSDQLDANKAEPSLDVQEVDAELDNISQVMMKISADRAIDEKVKKTVLELLQKIHFALRQYKLFGVDAFYEVFKDAFFFSIEKKDILESLKVEEHKEYVGKIVQNFTKFLAKVKDAETLHRYITVTAHMAIAYSQ